MCSTFICGRGLQVPSHVCALPCWSKSLLKSTVGQDTHIKIHHTRILGRRILRKHQSSWIWGHAKALGVEEQYSHQGFAVFFVYEMHFLIHWPSVKMWLSHGHSSGTASTSTLACWLLLGNINIVLVLLVFWTEDVPPTTQLLGLWSWTQFQIVVPLFF